MLENQLADNPATLLVSEDAQVGAAPRFPEPAALVSHLIEDAGLRGWTVEHRAGWTYLTPQAARRRVQGWKLHVSATALSAPEVLRVCLPILITSAASFKFAATAADLRTLNEFHCPRGNSGKFITVYPGDDTRLIEIAVKLHQATHGMAGPAILSDAPYAPGSLVHYRYGAFDGFRVLSNDGTYQYCILDPDTNPAKDKREGVFTPPPWAVPPVRPPHAEEAGEPSERQLVVLHDRYEVTAALRHANKGGVYRAHDRRTGREVIVKEARPHVATTTGGADARDYLRQEGAVLRSLAHLEIVPQVVEEFEQENHHFLVEELLTGETVSHSADSAVYRGDPRLPSGAAANFVIRLARGLRILHDGGVVLRDLSAQNVLVMPDGSVKIIDLELAAVRGPDGRWQVMSGAGGTPGFSAPEQFEGAAPDPRADLFSLGAITLSLVARCNPDFAPDQPTQRPIETRVADWLAPPLVPRTAPMPLRALIAGLLRTRPEERMLLDEVIALAEAAQAADPDADLWAEADPAAISQGDHWHPLIGGILGHLAAAAAREPAVRPWPETHFGRDAEPCAVQHGLAGSLAVVARLASHGFGDPAPGLLDALIERVQRHLAAERHGLPGLYFGSAGTAWALHDAGKALGRPDLSAQAVDLAASLPTAWPNPDIMHGLAGAGTCLLYLWQETGERALLQRAVACAENLLDAADSAGGTISWTIPPGFDSQLAGYCSYGFAHGTAGMGAFLLAIGAAADHVAFTDAARRCGDTLLDAAVTENGAAVWPDGPSLPRRSEYWCNGSSGVGTFLCRLHARTGDDRYLRASVGAARAVMRTRWRGGTAYCHGLAGNGDFLLDLAQVTGDDTYIAWAEAIAGLLWARRVYRDGRPVLPDESGREVTGGYGAGLSGHLSFLVRLRYGGPRLFHPDPGLSRPAALPQCP